MMKIIKYTWLVLILLVMSCQDFLEPKSQSEFVPELVQSLDEMLLGEVYFGPGDMGGLYSILGLFDDDVAARPNLNYDPSYEGDVEQSRLAFTWSNEMIDRLGGYNIYGGVYKKIVGCNAILDYIDGVKGTDNQKNNVKAQALSMRAYYYFYLVNLYGKPYSVDKEALGVPLKTTSALSTSSLGRSTVKVVYDQIVKDLLEAERLFKSLSQEEWWQPNNRASLPLAQLLLSRVYLYMEQWAESLTYGEKVIRDYKFNLLNLNVIDEPNPYEDPSYPAYYEWSNPEVIFLHGSEYDIVHFPLKEVSVFNGKWWSSQTICVTSDSLIRAYENADLRKSRYLIWESASSGTPVYRRPISKFMVGQNYNISYGSYGEWGMAFRLSEAYLNAAEAAAQIYKTKGDAEYRVKALELINDLRLKRFPSDAYRAVLIDEAGALVKFVREERRRELCFENHRWFDLRRYGMEEIRRVWYDGEKEIIHVLKKNDPGYTLLIPKQAFDLNSKLIQNEKRDE